MSFKNIFIQSIKNQFMGVIYYASGLVGYTWLMIALFPSMKSFNIDELLQQMPADYAKFFGGAESLQYSKIEVFLSTEYLSAFFVIIIAFYLSASSGSAIAGNIEKKNVDFDLSQPVSRTTYALSQISVTYFYTALLVFINTFFIWLLCHAYNVQISTSGLFAFFITATLFFWAIIGISVFLSSIFKNKLAVTLATVAFTLGSYVFLSLTNIVDKIKDYRFLSIYKLYDPSKLLESGDIIWKDIIILLFISAVGLMLSLEIFNKKDL